MPTMELHDDDDVDFDRRLLSKFSHSKTTVMAIILVGRNRVERTILRFHTIHNLNSIYQIENNYDYDDAPNG